MPAITKLAAHLAPAEGLSRLVLGLGDCNPLTRLAREPLQALARWLGRGEPAPPPVTVLGLVGLGPGLTPSGDDVLGGVLLALRALDRMDRHAQLATAVLPALPALTTPISAAHLAAAADGAAHELVHAAALAMLAHVAWVRRRGLPSPLRGRVGGGGLSRNRCATDRLRAALARLGRVGHCSGWDAFAGFALACDALNRTTASSVGRA